VAIRHTKTVDDRKGQGIGRLNDRAWKDHRALVRRRKMANTKRPERSDRRQLQRNKGTCDNLLTARRDRQGNPRRYVAFSMKHCKCGHNNGE
jgi:hypothetical protein